MKPYLFKIGSFELRIYSLMYILAFVIGIYIASKDEVAKKRGTTPTSIIGDVGHRKAVSKGGTNSLANLFVQSPSTNRSFSRKSDGSMRSERSKRER